MRGSPVALVARAAVTLLVLLYVAMAMVSGLDRMSLQAPALARLIPPELRAESARSAAAAAILRQDAPLALTHARQAVAADPVHPSSTALLGTAYVLSEDAAAAEAAFRVAARFGWRDPQTQLYWYEAALQAGDMARAVDRADALLRTRPDFPATERMLEPLENSPEGRAALIARMADRPGWLSVYYGYDEDLTDEKLDRRAVVLAELGAAGTQLGCRTVAHFVQTALKRGARAQAERVWTAHCPGATIAGGLADGGFEQFGGDAQSPFGWRGELSGDVTLQTAEKAGGNRVLQFRNRASVSRLVLRQALSLEPGIYRLTGEVAPGRIAASLGCGANPPMPSGVVGDIGGAGQLLRVAPCDRLELGLWVRPGTDEVELDAVALEKIG